METSDRGSFGNCSGHVNRNRTRPPAFGSRASIVSLDSLAPNLLRTPMIPIPLDAPEVLNREFFEIRARILQIAAALDRMDRAGGSLASDGRRKKIDEGLTALLSGDSNRAELVQQLFSLAYDSQWKEKFALSRPE
jgi:hypothetical protein